MSVQAIRPLVEANNHGTMRILHRGETPMNGGELKPTITVDATGTTYRFTTRLRSHYRCQKIQGLRIARTYEVNTFHFTCDCDAFKLGGIKCRHLLIAEALEQKGEL